MQTLRSKLAAIGALRTATMLALVIVLGTPALAPAQPAAQVVAFSYLQGQPNISVGVSIPRGIDTAARAGRADWGIRVTVTYVDVNNAVQTLDSGRLSIRNNTVLLQPIDSNTVQYDLTALDSCNLHSCLLYSSPV
jgi:hypothetical protein